MTEMLPLGSLFKLRFETTPNTSVLEFKEWSTSTLSPLLLATLPDSCPESKLTLGFKY